MATVQNRIRTLFDRVGERRLTIVATIALVGILPDLTSPFLAAHIVVMAIFALGYNIILGYGGELSFGHAAFFGLGAYATVLFLQHLVANVYIAALAAIVFVTIVSVIYGYLSLRRRGIYFAMVTLALAQMAYAIVFQLTGITGGSNGLSIPVLKAPLGPLQPMNNDMHFYLLATVVFLVLFAVTYRIVNSPFGRVLEAIRESEERALHLGYDVNHYLWLAFTMSGTISAVAGALYAVLFVFISPNILFWTMSGEVVLMTIMGGIGTLTGPLVGATVLIILRDSLTAITEFWQVFYGAVIIAVVLLAPEGLVGLTRKLVYEEEEGFTITELIEKLRS